MRESRLFGGLMLGVDTVFVASVRREQALRLNHTGSLSFAGS